MVTILPLQLPLLLLSTVVWGRIGGRLDTLVCVDHGRERKLIMLLFWIVCMLPWWTLTWKAVQKTCSLKVVLCERVTCVDDKVGNWQWLVLYCPNFAAFIGYKSYQSHSGQNTLHWNSNKGSNAMGSIVVHSLIKYISKRSIFFCSLCLFHQF